MEFVRGRLLGVVLVWDCHWDFRVVQSSAHKTFLLRDVDTSIGGLCSGAQTTHCFKKDTDYTVDQLTEHI